MDALNIWLLTSLTTGQGLPFDFCLNPDAGLPLPDVTMYLSLPPDVAASRAAYGVERYETLDIQNRVKAQFQLVAEQVRKRHGQDRWLDVSAEGSIEEVGKVIWNILESSLSRTSEPLGVLWRDE